MTEHTEHASIKRVRGVLESFLGSTETPITQLNESARTAVDAANALGIEVGQIASSIVFRIALEGKEAPLLVVTSGRHRVDTERVASELRKRELDTGKLGRADADFVRAWSGFAIGGVSPIGWLHEGLPYQPLTLVDNALAEYDVVWAAAGHTHAVFPTTFDQLVQLTLGTPTTVATD